MSGYIPLSRSFFDHPFWQDDRSLSLAEAWLDLIQSARFEVAPDKVLIKMKVIEISRGELRASIRFLANRWKWSKNKVSRFISLLESEQMIRREVRQGETVVTILNYNKFNPLKKEPKDSSEDSNEDTAKPLNGCKLTALKRDVWDSDGDSNGDKGGTAPGQIKERKESKELNSPFNPPKSDFEIDFDNFDLPHPGDEFRDLWLDLVCMPKWKNKPKKSLVLALKKLANYDEKFACQLISMAIEGNYQGVVFSDTDQRYHRWKSGPNGHFNPRNKLLQPTEWKDF